MEGWVWIRARGVHRNGCGMACLVALHQRDIDGCALRKRIGEDKNTIAKGLYT